MGNVPRRLRRFQRKGEVVDDSGIDLDQASYSAKPEQASKQMDKEVTMQLALDEVEKFKEKNQRLPKKEEYDRIAESIYSQLKDQAQRKKLMERYERKMQKQKEKDARHGRKGRKAKGIPGEEIPAELDERNPAFDELKETSQNLSQKDIKDMSVEDLFGESKDGKVETGSTSVDDEFSLEGMSDLDSGPEAQAKNTCPKCKAPTDKVIYCPGCGAAFCEKCALHVEQIGAVKTLTCPECSKKVKK